MEILLDPNKVGDILSLVASVSKEKSPLAFLAGVVIIAKGDKQVVLKATDTELSITTALECQVREEGEVCVNARALLAVMKRAEGRSVVLKQHEKGNMECQLGRSRYQLGVLQADEMPMISVQKKKPLLKVSVKEFSPLLEDVKLSASGDPSRYILNSIFLEKKDKDLMSVATDGRRLAMRHLAFSEAKENFGFPVPIGLIKILVKAFEFVGTDQKIEIFFDERSLGFHIGEITLTCRALEGNYPSWRQILPDEKEARFFTMNTDQLRNAVEGIIRIVPDPSHLWLERNSESSLKISNIGSLNSGEEYMEMNAPSKPFLPICVNGKYLLDAAFPLRGKLIKIGVIGPERPLIVQSVSDESYRAIIMPVLGQKISEKMEEASPSKRILMS